MPGHSLAEQQELADLKFRRLLVELRAVDVPEVTPPGDAPTAADGSMSPHLQVPASPAALPTLKVPLGAIAVSPYASSLPAIGVNLGHAPIATQAARLTALFVEHNQEPFARILFLSPDLSLLPLLGRYGFAFHRYQESYLREIPYLVARYGLQQIRALESGVAEWTNSEPPREPNPS